MVVQCPTCQSKFRIADDKVTDRGVRVRCTNCRNVFPVKKGGAAAADLASLEAAALARTSSRSGGAPAKPKAPAGPKTGGGSALDADDLFGMAELTGDAADGDAPLGDLPKVSKTGRISTSKPTAEPNFDDIDLEVEAPRPSTARPPSKPIAGSSRPPSKPIPESSQRPPSRPIAESSHRPPSKPIAGEGSPRPPSKPIPGSEGSARPPSKPIPEGLSRPPSKPVPVPTQPPRTAAEAALEAQAFESEMFEVESAVAVDPRPTEPPKEEFSGLELAIDPPAKPERLEQPEKAEPTPVRRPTTRPVKAPAPPTPSPTSARRELVGSAFTGLLGAAFAIAVVLVGAVSDEGSGNWLGITRASDVVATGVVSGLYDTASGKPVFYVRGTIENHGRKVRGPVRVVAELIADGNTAERVEVIAGAEPTPEDVWSVHSAADAERLARSLDTRRANRKLQPGGSLPFFAMIVDPPTDLHRHRVRVRVETVEAWVAPAEKAARGGR